MESPPIRGTMRGFLVLLLPLVALTAQAFDNLPPMTVDDHALYLGQTVSRLGGLSAQEMKLLMSMLDDDGDGQITGEIGLAEFCRVLRLATQVVWRGGGDAAGAGGEGRGGRGGRGAPVHCS